MSLNTYIRTIQLTGNSSLIVSIPKEWAKRNGLTRGSKVLLEIDKEGSLKVIPLERHRRMEEPAVYEERIENLSVSVKRLISAYIAGYDLLKIERGDNLDSKTMDKIKRTLMSKTLDTMIIDEKPNAISLKILRSMYDMDMVESIGWLSRHLDYMFDDLIRGIEQRDAILLEKAKERDDLIDQVYLVLTRYLTGLLTGRYSLHTSKIETPSEALHYYHGFKVIERIADHVSNIAGSMIRALKSDLAIPDGLTDSLRSAKELVREALMAFSQLNEDTAKELVSRLDRALEGLAFAFKKELERDPYIYSVMMSLSRILSYSLDIVEITFDIAILKRYIKRE